MSDNCIVKRRGPRDNVRDGQSDDHSGRHAGHGTQGLGSARTLPTTKIDTPSPSLSIMTIPTSALVQDLCDHTACSYAKLVGRSAKTVMRASLIGLVGSEVFIVPRGTVELNSTTGGCGECGMHQTREWIPEEWRRGRRTVVGRGGRRVRCAASALVRGSE